MSRDNSKDRCLCFVYRYAHALGRGCGNFRRARGLRLWLLDHDLIGHFTGWVWVNLLNDDQRLARAYRYHAKHPEVCWCDLVNASYIHESDYRKPYGCGCETPRLHHAQPPRGTCYCPTPLTAGDITESGDNRV